MVCSKNKENYKKNCSTGCRVWNYAFVYYYFIAGDWIVESYNQSALNICLAGIEDTTEPLET
ncbi:hypothetical protein IGI04_024090 [Brassica rapa subsp. trilocularis]|uniref:Uncharacterized protein n=1 Tax=Brassica rapa subsp. trilocularis TaxID=1813537 RepID=A0ABQ7M5Q8_BRACM|nr:hypothetical protein IGI04_024090 [Brassica rapa subsp. trilocularis]